MCDESSATTGHENQLIKDWEQTFELVRHEQELKQSRIRQWLTTQTIFFGFAGVLGASLSGETSPEGSTLAIQCLVLMALPLIFIFGFFSTSMYRRMDQQSSVYLEFLMARLVEIEKAPQIVLGLYSDIERKRLAILHEHQRAYGLSTEEVRQEYSQNPPFNDGSVHDQEAQLIRLIQLIWILLSFALLLVMLCTSWPWGLLIVIMFLIILAALVLLRRKTLWTKTAVHEFCESFQFTKPKLYDERDYLNPNAEVPKVARWILQKLGSIPKHQSGTAPDTDSDAASSNIEDAQ